MRHKAFTALVIIPLMLLFSALSGSAWAQKYDTHDAMIDAADLYNATDNIDMSVLHAMDPAAGRSPEIQTPADALNSIDTQITKERRTVQQPLPPVTIQRPTIDAPQLAVPEVSRPEIASPALPAVTKPPVTIAPIEVKNAPVPAFQVYHQEPLAASEDTPYPALPSSAPSSTSSSTPSSVTHKTAVSDTDTSRPRIISFPIKEKHRTESSDPSLAPSSHIQLQNNAATHHARSAEQRRSGLSGALVSAPLYPVAAPSASAEEEYMRRIQATGKTVTKIDSDVPLPARKPAKMMASDNFVQKSRIYAENMLKNRDMRINSTNHDNKVPSAAMAARPLKRVMAEPLSAPPDIGLRLEAPGTGLRQIQNDDLARKLVTPDKAQMIETIERVVELADRISRSGNKSGVNTIVNAASLAKESEGDVESRLQALSVPKLVTKGSEISSETVKHPVFSIPVDVPLPPRKPEFPVNSATE